MPQVGGKSKPPRKRKTDQGSTGRWFAVSADIFEHDIVGEHANTPAPADPSRSAWPPFMAWCWMLKEAAYRDRLRIINGLRIDLQRGQLTFSERFLATKANWSRKAAVTFLERLAKFGMVQLSTTARAGPPKVVDLRAKNRGPTRGPTITVVTICNYDRYQFGLHPQGANLGAKRVQGTTVVREKTKRSLVTYSNGSCGRVVADDAAATQSRVLKLVSKEAKA